MAYIKGHKDGAPCFLCSALRGRKDASTHVIYRGPTCFAVLNRFPYANGHLMVAPNAHRGSLVELTDAEMLELMDLTRRMQAAIGRAFGPHGYNLGMNLGRVAGAGLLGHLHLHIVPRWNGDTNFMPVTAGTKVMPMTLDEVYKSLRKALAKPAKRKTALRGGRRRP